MTNTDPNVSSGFCFDNSNNPKQVTIDLQGRFSFGALKFQTEKKGSTTFVKKFKYRS